MQRLRIPKHIQTEVLVKCRRRCCLCSGLKGDYDTKDGQIAHLDKDPSNNSPNNLAYLCLPHHNHFDSRTSQSKALTAEEVSGFRLDLWEWVKLTQSSSQSLYSEGMKAEPQLTRWGPVDGLVAGISINARNEDFVPWKQLVDEIRSRILPQVNAIHGWTDFRLADFHGKKDWVIEVLGKTGQVIANVWFGPDPLKNWAYDGLVRVGSPHAPAQVWQVFRRYSDGSYRRLDIDNFKASEKGKETAVESN